MYGNKFNVFQISVQMRSLPQRRTPARRKEDENKKRNLKERKKKKMALQAVTNRLSQMNCESDQFQRFVQIMTFHSIGRSARVRNDFPQQKIYTTDDSWVFEKQGLTL